MGRKRGKVRRALGGALKVLGVAVVALLGLVAGVAVHIDMESPRRFLAARASGLLQGTFEGEILVSRVGSVGLTHLGGVDAEVRDPEGRTVLRLQGVHARIGTLSAVRSLVSGERLTLEVPELVVDDAEAVLEEDEAGELSIARAFAAADTSEPAREEGSGTEVLLSDVLVRHAWVHGRLAAVPIVDADIEDAKAALEVVAAHTRIDLHRLSLRARGLEGVNPNGVVRASAIFPASEAEEREVEAHYDGRLGDVPVMGAGSPAGRSWRRRCTCRRRLRGRLARSQGAVWSPAPPSARSPSCAASCPTWRRTCARAPAMARSQRPRR
ncbi:MAG: hypothetical protein R3B70_42260 [Polyangiaceae bacterium]